MGFQTSLEALRVVPFLDVDHIGDRSLNLMPLWDGEQWHSWFPAPEGLVRIRMAGLVQGEYLANKADRDSDLLIRFLEFAWQRASWPEVFALWRHITDDVHSLATCAAKLEFFFAQRKAAGDGVCAFVQTELEYLLVLARSLFDLVQELVARLWSRRVRMLDGAAEARRKGRSLPETFSKMVLRQKGQRRTAEEVVADFGVTPALGRAYADAAEFFSTLRKVRDRIVHGGKAVDMIFVTEKGFCWHRDFPAFSGAGTDPVEYAYNANLVSLVPVVAHFVFGSIGACDALITALASEVQFPPEIAPDYHVFIRGYHNDALLRLQTVLEGGSPWWSDAPRSG